MNLQTRGMMTIVVAAACGALAVLWPDWRVALRAATYYQEGPHMDGEGSIFGTGRVTYDFELYCDVNTGRNELEVKWGKKNKFTLTALTRAACSDDPDIAPNPPAAGFDTYDGAGTGTLNGVAGALAVWTFTDAGEPGRDDFADIEITDPQGNVLTVSGMLASGNNQAIAK